MPSATDNCGTVTMALSEETIAGDCAGTFTLVRTFTATDDAGNSTSATQTITVVDTTAPELSIPADYTAECTDDLVMDDATATDNCTVCSDAFDFTSTVDGYGLSLELVASHEGGELDGMRTYRVYLDVASATDQVTSFTGNDEFALALEHDDELLPKRLWRRHVQRHHFRCGGLGSRARVRQLRDGWFDRAA